MSVERPVDILPGSGLSGRTDRPADYDLGETLRCAECLALILGHFQLILGIETSEFRSVLISRHLGSRRNAQHYVSAYSISIMLSTSTSQIPYPVTAEEKHYFPQPDFGDLKHAFT